jgi:chaperone required for assembly of F1-ATPase
MSFGKPGAAMSRKRFYQQATATTDHGIALDGRAVKTPGKQLLRLPTAALATAIAAEWNAQGPLIEPESMFLTKLANTAIDRVGPDRARILDEMAGYAGSDLVCYRADRPPRLVALQNAAWDPVLAWARGAMDAGFRAVTGVMPQPQPEAALQAAHRHFAAYDAFGLTALHNVMTLTGSALLAAMLGAGALSPEDAWAAAHVDEDYQIAEWGEDDAARARRGLRQREFADCVRFLKLLTA